ncbi:NAD(P)/FAD-dependent oxidoreductase [Amnibacterium soli]|uniref:NAD(P)/FAD-dependent oxidoreductase n=1 Tax=Amnibacterium soli TaxID=1282736 RepID=A0ABP8ZDE6_9MICO
MSDGRPRVAIVGAGVSGLVTARTLRAVGCAVTVFEKTADLGGVWSAERAYPGISTQDDRTSYAFSDHPMPPGVADHPTGAEVRRYLEGYALEHDLGPDIRLSTEVVRASLSPDDGWQVEAVGADGRTTGRYDWLVAANGVFCAAHVPAWPGLDAFERGGGRLLGPADVGIGEQLHGRRVAVIGWGKTACDLAVAAAERSEHTDVVVRTLTWKYPRRIGDRGLTFHHMVLTRAGERILGTPYRSRAGRILLRRIPERLPRLLIDRVLAGVVDRGLGLSALGLRPSVEFRASTSLVTDGFFEAVRTGRIRVHRDRTVAELGADLQGPLVRLSDGTVLRDDVVIAATGYDRDLAFLDPSALSVATADDGSLLLHRNVLSATVPGLAFIGWLQNYRSPLTSELLALWLAGVIVGRVRLPDEVTRRSAASRIHLDRDAARRSAGTPLPSLTLRQLDQLLGEIGLRLPRRVRLRQMWRPLDPADYAGLLDALLDVRPSGERSLDRT